MMDLPLVPCMTCGASFLLGFIMMLNPGRVNNTASRWLGLFVITLGMAMLEMALSSQNYQESNPKIFELISLSRFITAPALYLAIVSFTSLAPVFKRMHLWHFLPFLIFLCFRMPFFITGKNISLNPEIARTVFTILALSLPLQSVVYWALSLYRLERHTKNLKLFYSSTEKSGLEWLRNFLVIVGIIVVIWLNLLYFNLQLLIPYSPLLYLACLFFLAYFSLRQNEIYSFSDAEKSSICEITDNGQSVGLRQKRVPDEHLKLLSEKLVLLIKEQEIHLDNELTLPGLAGKLGVTANEASYLINEVYNANFYNFINRHRIEEAKVLLLSGQFDKLTVIGIAYQSGFSSKSTFNATFKKHTGMTPTQFVKQNTPATG